MPVINSSNQVAVIYLRGGQKYVRTNSSEYVFTPSNGISLAWINEQDVNQILRIPGGCCGNNIRDIFRIANDNQVALWEGREVRI